MRHKIRKIVIALLVITAVATAVGYSMPRASAASTPHVPAAGTSHPAAAASAHVIASGTQTEYCGAKNETWTWKIGDEGPGGLRDYSAVAWDSNPCGWEIQDRSQCWRNPFPFKGSYEHYSGKIKNLTLNGKRLWAAAWCWDKDQMRRAQERYNHYVIGQPNSWSPWAKYWYGVPPYPAYTTAARSPQSATRTGELCMAAHTSMCLSTRGLNAQLALKNYAHGTVLNLYAGVNQLKVAGTNHCLSDATGRVVLKSCNDSLAAQQYRAGQYGSEWNFVNAGWTNKTGTTEYLATQCASYAWAYDLDSSNCYNWVWRKASSTPAPVHLTADYRYAVHYTGHDVRLWGHRFGTATVHRAPVYTTLWGKRLQVVTVATPRGPRRYASTLVDGVRHAILNAPVGADNKVYSSPEVCTKDIAPGAYCLANRGSITKMGNHVQIAWHSRRNNTMSHFYVMLLGWVSRYWPFDIKNYDVGYYGHAVVEFEWVKPDSGGGSNLCVSTYDSQFRKTTDGKWRFWFPIRLYLCTSKAGSDPYQVVMVWDNSGSSGHTIEPVYKVNQTSQLWWMNCVYYKPPQTHCQTGDGITFGNTTPALLWAHYGRA